MPMVDLTIPAGAISSDHQARLVRELTDLIVKWEEGTDAPGYSYAAWTYVHEAAGVAIAGELRAEQKAPLYRVVISVPKGSLNDARKAGLVADVTAAVMRLEPRERWRDDPNRVWCLVNDVPDGDWGAGGRIMRLRDLAEIFDVARRSPGRYAELEFDSR